MSRRVGHELFPEAVVDDGVHHPEPAGVLDVLVDVRDGGLDVLHHEVLRLHLAQLTHPLGLLSSLVFLKKEISY